MSEQFGVLPVVAAAARDGEGCGHVSESVSQMPQGMPSVDEGDGLLGLSSVFGKAQVSAGGLVTGRDSHATNRTTVSTFSPTSMPVRQ
ncbi:hypothetical protein AB0K16_53525 [Nonomuraea jabiensis]|uniref:hypothetical protein n=1 Tax=Nonomuraea jabiensis TaxID=882448 RepID=UPI00342A12C8